MVDRMTKMRFNREGEDSLFDPNERFSDELRTSTPAENKEIKRQMNALLGHFEVSLEAAWIEYNKKTRHFR